MGCNCKVTKQLEELHESFGVSIDPSFGDLFKFKLEDTFTRLFLPIFTLTVIPLFFAYVAIENLKGNDKISITDLFLQRNKHVEQQSFFESTH